MSRPVLTRAIFAPVAIVIATTVVLPANPNFSQVNEWFTETLPATAASISLQTNDTFLRMGQASRLASRHLAETLLQTVAVISSETAASLSRLDSMLAEVLPTTPVPDTLTVAALPHSVGDEQGKPADKPLRAQTAPEAASESLREPLIEKLPPLPELKSLSVDMPAEKPVLASLGAPAVAIDARAPVAAALPAEEPKIARDDKPEEKQVFASLGSPVSVSDARIVAPDPLQPEEAKVAHEYKPIPAASEDRPVDYASLGSPASLSETSNAPVKSPLKLRALTRADIPSAEKSASLGSPAAQSDARTRSSLSGIVPPEQQRVAYDALPASEQPTSIGKRRYGYVDETKYTGLGKPEALLEALKHMGANAQKLGLPATLWCADFMNMVLRKVGIEATGSRAARSYIKYGKQIDEPRVGAIAIFTRGKDGGHIGIVRGTDGNGNPIIVSGNYNNRVAEAVYPKARVIAYVVPR